MTLEMSSPFLAQEKPRVMRRVLVVDDEDAVVSFYRRVLASPTCEVMSARNGLEARDLLKSSSFDVIVTDIFMPGLDGIQFLRSVRRQDLDVPVLVTTGEPGLETAVQALEHGAFRYLRKPIKAKELRDLVAQAIRVHDLAKLKQQSLALLQDRAQEAMEGANLGEVLAEALDSVWMAYQPIVSWSQRSTFAYEALVRSEHSSLSNPRALFDAAQQVGRIHDLGRVIRRCIARDIQTLPASELVFVNLHPVELEDELLYDADNPLLSQAGRVVLEITERASLAEIPKVRERMALLRAAGFRLAVDDLGAGYAGLNSFIHLDPEVTKVDISLVREVHRHPTKQRLIRSILEVCNDLEVQVVIEGVETDGERAVLVGLGADLMQGHLFAAPSEPFVQVPQDAFQERRRR